jgi:RNA polymerase sigma factor (sigma-70 family)
MDRGKLVIPRNPRIYMHEFLTLRREITALRKQRAFYADCEDCTEKTDILADLREREKRMMRKEREARALIDKLPKKVHQQVITWRYINDMSTKQIAEALGVSVSRTHKINAEAMQWLERVLNPIKPQIHQRDPEKRTEQWWDE